MKFRLAAQEAAEKMQQAEAASAAAKRNLKADEKQARLDSMRAEAGECTLPFFGFIAN